MALYERLLGNEPKIPIHAFQAVVAERARGSFTFAQVNDAIELTSGQRLTAAEEAEFAALVATIPSGSNAAQSAMRALRLLEIDQVLLLVDQRIPPYDTVGAIKTRLGV